LVLASLDDELAPMAAVVGVVVVAAAGAAVVSCGFSIAGPADVCWRQIENNICGLFGGGSLGRPTGRRHELVSLLLRPLPWRSVVAAQMKRISIIEQQIKQRPQAEIDSRGTGRCRRRFQLNALCYY
jgi:hypothetical protein